MLIERVDPRGDDVRPFFDLYQAAERIDDPHGPPSSYTDFRGHLIWGWAANVPQTWLGWADDRSRPLGGYILTLPVYDNTHLGELNLIVHPEVRRHGYGRALLQHAIGRIRGSGRRLLMGETLEGSAGLAFCDALGAERASMEVRSVQDLADVDETHLRELLAQARTAAEGYSLLSWAGTTPERHVDDVATLLSAMSDAPVDQLEWKGEVWDAERVRQEDKGTAESRVHSYTVVARHDASGALVGHTRILVPEEHHGWAHQGDTVVLPDHRGHRLGTLIKAAMVPWLGESEPDVRRVVTGNAESNSYMLRVNRLLGYRPLDRSIGCQLRLEPR